LIAVVCFTIN